MAEGSPRHPDATWPPVVGEEATKLQLLLDMAKALDEEKEEILRKARENDERKADILEKIKEIRLKDTDAKIPDNIIIAFVEALLKANRYFDLKQYLRERRCFEELDNGQSDIYHLICEKVQEENPFGNEEIEICHAVQLVRRELAVEWNRSQRAEYENRFSGRDMQYLSTRRNLTPEEQEELLAYMFPRFHKHDPKVTDLYVHSSPILDLVYQIREKDYVMDKKPEEELQKIQISNPGFYNDYFVYPEEPMNPMEYSDDTVAVMNAPFYTATCHIVELLEDCGELAGIRKERGKNSITGKKGDIIFVTFEDSLAAKRALLKESPLIDGCPVEITTPQSASAWLKPKEVKTISNIESAVEKYNEFRNKYQKQSSDVEDVSSAHEEGNPNRKRKRASPSKNEDEVLATSDSLLFSNSPNKNEDKVSATSDGMFLNSQIHQKNEDEESATSDGMLSNSPSKNEDEVSATSDGMLSNSPSKNEDEVSATSDGLLLAH